MKENINIQLGYLNEMNGKKREREANEKNQQKKQFMETSESLRNKEKETRKKQRKLMEEMTKFNQRMAKEKMQKMEDEIREEFRRDANTRKRIQDEKHDFFKYAESCINNWQKGGQNVMPLLLEMKKYKDFLVRSGEHGTS